MSEKGTGGRLDGFGGSAGRTRGHGEGSAGRGRSSGLSLGRLGECGRVRAGSTRGRHSGKKRRGRARPTAHWAPKSCEGGLGASCEVN